MRKGSEVSDTPASTADEKTEGAGCSETDRSFRSARAFSERVQAAGRKARDQALRSGARLREAAPRAPQISLSEIARGSSGALAAFLALPELLKWTERLSKSSATIYDRALDAEYLRTHIGGGNHRLFDGGHDLLSAWRHVREACNEDSLAQEIMGYAAALWKDAATPRGLPFATLDKASYEAWANQISSSVPGVSRAYLYDLASFDALEIAATSLGVVSVLFALRSEDQEKLSEILGSMGVVSILAANPLMGIAAIALLAHVYCQNVDQSAISRRHLATGAATSLISTAIFAVLGLPILVELAIALTVTATLRRQILRQQEILRLISSHIRQLGSRAPDALRLLRVALSTSMGALHVRQTLFACFASRYRLPWERSTQD